MLEEWQHYRNVLKECNIEEKTLWLDIRGNHGKIASSRKTSKYTQNYLKKYHLFEYFYALLLTFEYSVEKSTAYLEIIMQHFIYTYQTMQ